ncbi:7633_t:CDS:10 [Scutellospora calospora]|uniref:7633_t:CDS:1 n=1 Tax=Scutellospora calospora TaxID=85575 RepID=A0ACA9K7Z0_9GLOM|nr:7633_t:CDS:10 [Scutellospora calospora]
MSNNVQLKQLAERSRSVANTIVKHDLPLIERNLEQIEKQSRKLADKVVKPGEAPERKAPYFLANIGIDGDKLTQDVKSISVLGAFEPRAILLDTDVERYLDHKHQQTITSIIKDGYTQTDNEYNALFDCCLSSEWDKTKRKVFEEFGQHITMRSTELPSSAGGSVFRSQFSPSASLSSSFRASTSKPSYITSGERRISFKNESTLQLNQRHLVYFDVVVKLNNARLAKIEYGIINEFHNAARKISLDYGRKVVQCWRALASIVGESNVIDGSFKRNPLKQRQFAPAYQAPTFDTAYKSLCFDLINGAKRYLEESYREWSTAYVNSFRNEAMLGGQPSAVNMARAVLRAIHRPNGGIPTTGLRMVENIPVWGHIFILVRQGYYKEALEVAKGYENVLPRQDLQFVTYFERLPSHDRQKLVAEMKQWNPLTFQDKDPYKFIMYQIVAQLEELPQKPSIESFLPTSEDFMWIRLMCVREIEPVVGAPNDTLSLDSLQKAIRNLGPSHFNHGGKDTMQYFRALLLTAQFERTDFTEDAVHFAIALAYYGLLKIPEKGEAMALLVEVGDRMVPYLNFNTLLCQYARSLAKGNAPSTAFQYLILLYLQGNPLTEAGRYQIELCHEYIRQLIYDTEAFNELGKMREYMSLMFIDNEDEFTETIINTLARQCVEDGKFKAARSLYELTQNFEEIIVLLNKMLAEYIWISIRGVIMQPETAKELDPQEISRILKGYEHIGIRKISQNRLKDSHTLLSLVDFVELYKKQDFVRAVSIIQQIELFPFEDDISIIQQKASAIEAFDDQLKNCIPELLHITMRCIYAYYQQLKDHMAKGTPGIMRKYMDESVTLQRKARALVTFAGVLSSDIYHKLHELDVQMR